MRTTVAAYFILAKLFFFTACQNDRRDNTHWISGTLENASGKKIYLSKVTENGDVIIDSALANKSGHFKIKNPATGPDYYLLRNGPGQVSYLILYGNENIELKGDANNLENSVSVKGSEDTELLHLVKKYRQDLSDSLNSVYVKSREDQPLKKDSVGVALQGVFDERLRAFALEKIRNKPASLISLTLSQLLDKNRDLEYLLSIEKELISKFPDNKYVQEYAAQIANYKQLPIGSVTPGISLLSPEGKRIQLGDFKGKVVLIDFWASWCAPCLKEMPYLVELYERYRAMGFEIFGVSLDSNHDAWKAAIYRHKITWVQVSDLKRWDSETAKKYFVDAIPYTILVDRHGKIAAKGLHGAEIELHLKKLLAAK